MLPLKGIFSQNYILVIYKERAINFNHQERNYYKNMNEIRKC